MADDFSDVFDRDSGAKDTAAPVADSVARDEAGRYAPKPDQAPAEVAKEPAAETQQATPEPEDRQQNRHVPLRELLAERDRFKSEKTLREEAEKRATDHEARYRNLEQQLQQLQQRPAQQQQPVQQQQPEPDPYVDPEGWANRQQQKAHDAARGQIVNNSEFRARRQFGTETFDKAFAAAQAHPDVLQYLFHRSPEPGFELVEWHNRQQALQRIGPDPEAYAKKLEVEVEARVRAKVLAELKAGGANPPTRFPGSLADATAAGSQGQHMTQEAMADEIFSTNRNRRA